MGSKTEDNTVDMQFKTHLVIKSVRGFTLIELVVVIIILGILAVIAVPKFIDLSSDAKASVVKGISGAVNDAANMHSLKFKLSSCNFQHNRLDNVVMHHGQIYSGDWEISMNADCSYSQLPNNGVPEIIEAMEIDTSEFWMLHTRNGTAPYQDELWIAPFPPEDKKGVHQVTHNAPATNATELIATGCYIRYQTPRSLAASFNVEYQVSGC